MSQKRTPITAWSYSRLALYESCPFLHEARNILKLPEPKAEAMIRGIKIHNEAAKYLSGETDRLPASCQLMENSTGWGFKDLKSFHPIVEQQWAFKKNWGKVSWFDKKTWLRVTLDAAVLYTDGWAEAVDHKTGKRRDDDYMDQMGLFAGALIKKFPLEVHKGVTVRLWYLDSGEEFVEDIPKKEALAIVDDLSQRAEVMMHATRFPPKPSWKCGWCHHRRENGGICKY